MLLAGQGIRVLCRLQPGLGRSHRQLQVSSLIIGCLSLLNIPTLLLKNCGLKLNCCRHHSCFGGNIAKLSSPSTHHTWKTSIDPTLPSASPLASRVWLQPWPALSSVSADLTQFLSWWHWSREGYCHRRSFLVVNSFNDLCISSVLCFETMFVMLNHHCAPFSLHIHVILLHSNKQFSGQELRRRCSAVVAADQRTSIPAEDSRGLLALWCVCVRVCICVFVCLGCTWKVRWECVVRLSAFSTFKHTRAHLRDIA